ncbi:MAG: hypothetical protein H5T69_20630, partial [Chloroflexi bacterium]|nr:hypothetical protein [Chloroflexota bacterium]
AMSERYARSIFWPVLLILLGVALLLQQVGVIEWSWADALRLWPILLILAGLDILIGHSRVAGLLLLVVGLGAILALLWLSGSFRPLGSAEPQEMTYSARGVETATIVIDAGLGRLRIEPLEDSDNLIKARVILDRRRGELLCDRQTTNGHAQVRLRARYTSWGSFIGQAEDDWRIGLAPTIPIDLRVNAGVSSVELNLEGLTLSRLDIDLGVGEAHLVMAAGDYKADINGGIGSLVIEIP